MPKRRNYIEIKNDARIRLENGTPVTNFGPMSTITHLTDMIGLETEKLYDEVEYLYSIMDPTNNHGRELDNLGFIFRTSRKSSATAADYSYNPTPTRI